MRLPRIFDRGDLGDIEASAGQMSTRQASEASLWRGHGLTSRPWPMVSHQAVGYTISTEVPNSVAARQLAITTQCGLRRLADPLL